MSSANVGVNTGAIPRIVGSDWVLLLTLAWIAAIDLRSLLSRPPEL
jgi:hypothetical protein